MSEYCKECGQECDPVTQVEPGFWDEAWGANRWFPEVEYTESDCCHGEVTNKRIEE